MTWIIFGLLSHFSWALVNVGDKYLVGNKIKHPIVYMFFFFWIGLIVLFIIPFVDFTIPSSQELMFLLGAGIFWKVGGLLYIKAIEIEEATRLSVWWSFIPVWSLILGFIFFGNRLETAEVIGFIVLLVASILSSVHVKTRRLIFSKAVWYMIIACFIYALAIVLIHEVTQTVTPVVSLIWSSILPLPFTMLLFLSKQFRHDFWSQVRAITTQTATMMVGIRIVDTFGFFFSITALSMASAALVSSLEGSQALFVFGMVVLISLFAPKAMKEELDSKNVVLKLVAVVLMVVGVMVLAL